MKINFTKKQFWDVMRGMYMADWMANAICEADMEQDDGIKEARNHMFSFAKEMGFDAYVGYDEKLKKHFATFDMDDEPTTRALIDRYDDDMFWNELVERLGERDFLRMYTPDEIQRMTQDERFEKRMACDMVWEQELEDYGIDRVEIGKHDGPVLSPFMQM